MLSIGGLIFMALAIGILVKIIESCIKFGAAAFNWFLIVPILLFVLLPMALASVALFLAGKEAYHWIRESKAKKSSKGIETTARIIDYKVVAHKRNVNKRYALVLAYEQDGKQKTFTTHYIFDINEYRYLKTLEKIKIKVDKNFVAVTEAFTEDIYELDPKYEIELDFYKQKPVAITLKVWRITCIIAIIFLFVSIVLTTVLNNGLFLIIGVSILFAVNMPVAIILAVYLIRWIWGNDKNKYKQNKYKNKQANKLKNKGKK